MLNNRVREAMEVLVLRQNQVKDAKNALRAVVAEEFGEEVEVNTDHDFEQVLREENRKMTV